MPDEAIRAADSRRATYPAIVKFRAPEALPVVLNEVANQKQILASEYARRALIEQLRRDGYDFHELMGAT